MYIEVFLLDNLIMDALIIRAASALSRRGVSLARLALFSLTGAAFSYLSLWILPVATPLPALALKASCLLALAFAFRPKRFSEYFRACCALMLSAFLIGGAALAISLSSIEGVRGGVMFAPVTLRVALIAALAASFMPRVIRAVRKRLAKADTAALEVTVMGRTYSRRALIDTGSDLREPLSGLPVIVAEIPSLAERAWLPVPAVTVGGNAMLYALAPEQVTRITLDGEAAEALIAPVKRLNGCEAIVPHALYEGAGAQKSTLSKRGTV